MDVMDPKTLDPYRYAENNPVFYTDATGLSPESVCGLYGCTNASDSVCGLYGCHPGKSAGGTLHKSGAKATHASSPWAGTSWSAGAGKLTWSKEDKERRDNRQSPQDVIFGWAMPDQRKDIKVTTYGEDSVMSERLSKFYIYSTIVPNDLQQKLLAGDLKLNDPDRFYYNHGKDYISPDASSGVNKFRRAIDDAYALTWHKDGAYFNDAVAALGSHWVTVTVTDIADDGTVTARVEAGPNPMTVASADPTGAILGRNYDDMENWAHSQSVWGHVGMGDAEVQIVVMQLTMSPGGDVSYGFD